MGISGLLPFLKKASQGAHLKDFKGQTAAVDAYCWLHKGAFSCADKLVKGEPTNGYVIYVMKQVSLLLSHGIKPIMVFDGCHLPSKAVTETKRRENREKNRKQAKELLRQGRAREALEHFRRCVEVTSEMAFEVISACRARNIDVVVAPYEADAQLAFLNLKGIAQVVITEDSDLIVFGCKSTLFKLDSNGGCVFVDHEKLHLAMNIPRDKFSFEKFRNITILSGCDYLPSLPGIGLVKACKFFSVTANTDIYNVLSKLPSYLNMPNLEVTQEYREKFMQAINTFLYQLVFDPISQTLRPLSDYPDGMGPNDYPYAGKFVGHERARQIALGNVNVQTGEVVDHFDPEIFKPTETKSSSWEPKEITVSTHPSIWIKEIFKKKIGAPCLLDPGRPTASGKEVTVAMPLFNKKHTLESEEDNISEQELKDLYSQPQKRKKIEASPEPLEEQQVENMNKDHITKLLDTGCHTTSPTVPSKDVENPDDLDMNFVTPPETSKSKNPFAKKHMSPKKVCLPNSNYSSIKKFSKMKKTVMDSNIIVQSRFFSPNIPLQSNNSELDVKPNNEVDQSTNISSGEKDHDSAIKESESLEDSPRGMSSPLSPVLKSKSIQKSSFIWKRFSNVNSSDLRVQKIQASAAASSTFKTVIPKDKCEPPAVSQSNSLQDEAIPSEENALSPEKKSEEVNSKCELTSSQTSLCSDMDSIDNESFGLTPSLPSSLENSTVMPLKDATNCPSKSYCYKSSIGDAQESVSINKSQCRNQGLQRTNKSKEAGKKQLSLTDMFSFKRDGRKLQLPKSPS
ncbi:exonuclease 1-like isoform X2 [Portunus trituberculatus]|uniref:exonuclease 1-like isoform X2 n=1 Tax=Portunus trituberculatus TaxID=210409 RepID=UPI001E1D1119|nr:exonuclease 1-like isoform X2 [Portunus trituberculatus]